jgi:hypothetical protein
MDGYTPFGAVTFILPLIPEWKDERQVKEDNVQVDTRSVIKVAAYLKADIEAPFPVEDDVLAFEYPSLFTQCSHVVSDLR